MKRTAEEKYDAGKGSKPTAAADSGESAASEKVGIKKGFGEIKFDDLDLIGTLGIFPSIYIYTYIYLTILVCVLFSFAPFFFCCCCCYCLYEYFGVCT